MGIALNFDAAWEELVKREQAIHDAKRAAYTGEGDPLANYRNASAIAAVVAIGTPVNYAGGLPAMTVRLQEKLYRLALAVHRMSFGQEAGESFEDTCIDIAVIAKLCAIEAQRVGGDLRPEPASSA